MWWAFNGEGEGKQEVREARSEGDRKKGGPIGLRASRFPLFLPIETLTTQASFELFSEHNFSRPFLTGSDSFSRANLR